MYTCKICGSNKCDKIHIAKEMMFGIRDSFRYLECNSCGCVQLLDEISDFSKYYPDQYYSFSPVKISNRNTIKDRTEKLITRYSTGNFNPGYYFLSKIFGIHHFCKWLSIAKVKPGDKILDIGCGNGDKLIKLNKLGYNNLYGIDPFIKSNIIYDNGVSVFKKNVFELNDKYDFIMLHHSLEHMPDQLGVLQKVYTLLNDNRFVLVRLPAASSFAWNEYGINWFQLDAPRHLFLHTHQSISLLAEEAGFRVYYVYFDSSEAQFLGSIQYMKDIPFYDERSYTVNIKKSIFSKRDVKYYRRKARQLNKNGEGDSVCYFLLKQ